MVTTGNCTARALATHHPPPPSLLPILPSLLLFVPPSVYLYHLFLPPPPTFLSMICLPKPLPPALTPHTLHLLSPHLPVLPLSPSEVFFCGVDFRSCFPLSLIGLISVFYWGSVYAERAAERAHRPACPCVCVCLCVCMYVFETTIVFQRAGRCTSLCASATVYSSRKGLSSP